MNKLLKVYEQKKEAAKERIKSKYGFSRWSEKREIEFFGNDKKKGSYNRNLKRSINREIEKGLYSENDIKNAFNTLNLQAHTTKVEILENEWIFGGNVKDVQISYNAYNCKELNIVSTEQLTKQHGFEFDIKDKFIAAIFKLKSETGASNFQINAFVKKNYQTGNTMFWEVVDIY